MVLTSFSTACTFDSTPKLNGTCMANAKARATDRNFVIIGRQTYIRCRPAATTIITRARNGGRYQS